MAIILQNCTIWELYTIAVITLIHRQLARIAPYLLTALQSVHLPDWANGMLTLLAFLGVRQA